MRPVRFAVPYDAGWAKWHQLVTLGLLRTPIRDYQLLLRTTQSKRTTSRTNDLPETPLDQTSRSHRIPFTLKRSLGNPRHSSHTHSLLGCSFKPTQNI